MRDLQSAKKNYIFTYYIYAGKGIDLYNDSPYCYYLGYCPGLFLKKGNIIGAY